MSPDLNDVVILHGFFKPDFYLGLMESGCKNFVVLEGRPSLDSGRDTVGHLQKIGIVPTIIADNMAGYLFSRQAVKKVWISSQVSDKSGAMCEIGSFVLAVLAKTHHVPLSVSYAARKSKPFGKAGDLQKFNGQTVIGNKVKAFVPLLEWIPKKYLVKNHE